MTRVVIAHRLSAIMGADTVYVIKDGVIAESGSPAELMLAGGLFQQFATTGTAIAKPLEDA